jgi:Flp pilus assembly protein TadD
LWKEDDAAMTYPGYLFMEQKMFNEALEVFKFNVELNPTSGYAYGHLGVAYARSGKKQQAKENLTKAIELVPTEKYFKDELNKLIKKKTD